MCNKIELTPNKTYKTKENAEKAFEKKYGHIDNLRYFVAQDDNGRYFPVCLFGNGDAMKYGVHFNFNVVG